MSNKQILKTCKKTLQKAQTSPAIELAQRLRLVTATIDYRWLFYHNLGLDNPLRGSKSIKLLTRTQKSELLATEDDRGKRKMNDLTCADLLGLKSPNSTRTTPNQVAQQLHRLKRYGSATR